MARAEEILDLTPLPGADVDVGNDALVIADASAGVQKKIIVSELPGGGEAIAFNPYEPADERFEIIVSSEEGNVQFIVREAEVADYTTLTLDNQGAVVRLYSVEGTQFNVEDESNTILSASSTEIDIGGFGLEGADIFVGPGTGSKIGLFGASPVVQPAAIADATDNPTAITQLNDLLAKLRLLGLIAPNA